MLGLKTELSMDKTSTSVLSLTPTGMPERKVFMGETQGQKKIKVFSPDNKRGGTKAPWNVLQENVILRATAGVLAS